MTSAHDKPKILLLGEITHPRSRAAWSSLSESYQVLTPHSSDPAAFLSECRAGTFDGITAAYRTFDSVKITGRIEGDVVAALARAGLKFLSHNGAGYDQINVPDCTQHGIKVSNTPEAVDDATADTALFLLLGALRGFNLPLLNLRKGDWRGKNPPPLGHDPQGKVLGILGMGGIGRNVKRKAEAFGMEVVYHNRKRLPEKEEAGARYVEFEELLGKSDALSLNLPLNKNTRHIIGAKEFEKMKDGIVIVNTARGPVMDEAALVEALKKGKVFSVGLDVYENEPEVLPGLIENESVLLLPHMGTATAETQEKMELLVIDNVKSALEKGTLLTPVPEQQ